MQPQQHCGSGSTHMTEQYFGAIVCSDLRLTPEIFAYMWSIIIIIITQSMAELSFNSNI